MGNIEHRRERIPGRALCLESATFRNAGLHGRASRYGTRAPVQDESGNTIVETALMLPLLLLVLLAIFKVGMVFNQAISLTQAANIGAQVLQTDRWSKSNDPCLDVFNAIKGAAPTLNSKNITLILTLNNNPSITATSTTTCSGKQSQLQQGGPVALEVKYPFSFSLIGYGSSSFVGSATWSGTMSSGKITELEY